MLSSKKICDSFCRVDGCPFRISKFAVENNETFVYGNNKCLNHNPFFTQPIDSRELGIIQFDNESDLEEKFNAKKIDPKYYKAPVENTFRLIPLLQNSFTNFFS